MESFFCEDKKDWNDFVLKNNGSFLQSFEWGELQKKSGLMIFRIGIKGKDGLILQAQISKESSFSKNYLYIAFGPVIDNNLDQTYKNEAINFLLKKIDILAKKENCIFARIEPLEAIGRLSGYKINKPLRRIQPKRTLIINLERPDQDILKDFSSTTRHNIKRAEKFGVIIKELDSYSPDFYNLLSKTKERQEFSVYPENHYKDIFEVSNETFKVKLFLAEYDNRIINATISLFFNGRAVTLHSGSDYNYRNVKGTNLLKWTIMESAKKNGVKEIDMWGIDEKKWPNLTMFKKGFGGQEFEYPEGLDIIFQNFWYNIYRIIRTIKR